MARETKQQFAERVARDNSTDYTGMTFDNGFGGTVTVLKNLGSYADLGGWDLYEVEDDGVIKRWTSALLYAASTRMEGK